MNGLVLIDKPSGCTSHDVVNRWRRLAGIKRVGHLGTLDPLATGLLAILSGTATRLAPFYERLDKTYQATITFGATSNTYDADGDVVQTGAAIPSSAHIEAAAERFRGRFQQTPPPVSAKKIGGVAAYKLARKNLPVDLKPVEVEVRELTLGSVRDASLEMEVSCSAGTYIRSIAHDLGEELGCGAILSRLRRTRIGEFSIDQARTLVELEALAKAGKLGEALIPAGKLLPSIPAEHVDLAVEAQIRQGRQFRTSPFVVSPGAPIVRVLSRSGELVAIGKMVIPNLYQPTTVFQE